MKKILTAAAIATASTAAHADPGVFVGLTYTIGSNNGVGFTLQATSSNKEDTAVVAGGVSYYPFAPQPKFGLPVGIGYQGTNAAGLVSYDLLLKDVAVSGGYANTHGDAAPAPVVVPD